MRVVLLASAFLLVAVSGCLEESPKTQTIEDEDSGTSCTFTATNASVAGSCTSTGSPSSSSTKSTSGTATKAPSNTTGNQTAGGNATAAAGNATGNTTGNATGNATGNGTAPPAPTTWSCSGQFGTSPVGLSYTGPGGPIGGCNLGTAPDAGLTVVKLAATNGCEHDVSPTGTSNGYGTPNEEGKTWPAGATFRIICEVGVGPFSGTLDWV